MLSEGEEIALFDQARQEKEQADQDGTKHQARSTAYGECTAEVVVRKGERQHAENIGNQEAPHRHLREVAYLKSGVYEKRVFLQSPEKNRMATEFARKGIAVVGSEELKPFFTFAGSQQSPESMVIDIHYKTKQGAE